MCWIFVTLALKNLQLAGIRWLVPFCSKTIALVALLPPLNGPESVLEGSIDCHSSKNNFNRSFVGLICSDVRDAMKFLSRQLLINSSVLFLSLSIYKQKIFVSFISTRIRRCGLYQRIFIWMLLSHQIGCFVNDFPMSFLRVYLVVCLLPVRNIQVKQIRSDFITSVFCFIWGTGAFLVNLINEILMWY